MNEKEVSFIFLLHKQEINFYQFSWGHSKENNTNSYRFKYIQMNIITRIIHSMKPDKKNNLVREKGHLKCC